MQTKAIAEYAKDIKFTHLYFSQIKLTKLSNYKDFFASYESFDLDSDFPLKSNYEFIFIELNAIDKNIIKTLNEVVKLNKTKNIFAFAIDQKNIVLSKFLIYSSLGHALPLVDDDKVIQESLYNSLKQVVEQRNIQQKLNISKKADTIFSFLVFKNNRLTFANDNAKKLFGLQNLSSLENSINTNRDIKTLLMQNQDNKTEIFLIYKEKKKQFTTYLNNFPDTKEKLISIIENVDVSIEKPSYTIDKFCFVDILKDNLVQSVIDKSPLILMFINVSNYKKLKSTGANIAIYNLIKKILHTLFSKKEFYEKLVYWSEDFYIIYTKEREFSVAKKFLETMHEKIMYLDYEEDFLPSITSSILDVSLLELNQVLDCIENIHFNTYNKDDFKTDNFHTIHSMNGKLDQIEYINYILNGYLNNKKPIKLLNIYKGLCINTQSKILKIKDNNFFISCSSLQTYPMKLEGKTVIQVPNLPKDVQAHVSYLDTKKSYAILNKLSFIDFSANNRQYTRVQPAVKMPISIQYKKYSFQGKILDISTKAIAISLNYVVHNEYLNKMVRLNFRLPNSSSEEGYDIMDIEAKIVNIIISEETKTKLVALFELEEPYSSYLLKYMYDRQKELIIELKRVSRL